MKVCHYRCYDADRRVSMEVLADSMQACLQGSELEVVSFKPSSALERFSANRHIMRYLRYFDYPRKVTRQNADIHHVTDHGYAHLYPKLAGGKKCISVHDLIPMLNWKGKLYDGLKGFQAPSHPKKPTLNLYSLSFVHKYDHVVTISESTANDLVTHLAINRDKITVIPPVIDECFTPVESGKVEAFVNKYGLDTSCKWIMISGLEFYKNHSTSLQVLKELNRNQDQKIKLIKTGLPSAEFNSLVESMGLAGLVETIYFQDLKELPLLYNFVDCLLFPSLYEGFGMPVAEALACGTPVITSNRGALPEAGGTIAIQLNPFATEELSKAVYAMLYNADMKAKVYHEGPKWVAKFRPDVIAHSLEKLYEQLVSSEN